MAQLGELTLQDSSNHPRALRSLTVRQTQISATTSPTGGLLPLPCLLSCFGFVSTYRTPHLCSLSVFSLSVCLVSFLPSVCSFISSFICLLENTTAASKEPRAGRSKVEVWLHEEVPHLSYAVLYSSRVKGSEFQGILTIKEALYKLMLQYSSLAGPWLLQTSHQDMKQECAAGNEVLLQLFWSE